MSSQSKSGTPGSKASPATPRVSRLTRTPSKSDADSPSPFHNPKSFSIERSPRTATSKSGIARPSSRIATPPEKPQSRIFKPSELQAQLSAAQDDLKKAKEKLHLVEMEKAEALGELEEARKSASDANEKLKESIVAQKRAEESSEIDKFRAVELEQAGIEAVKKKEEDWQKELQEARNQHDVAMASLLSTTEELQRVKQELTMVTDTKNQAMIHADDATKIAEIHAQKAEILSAELVRLKGLLDESTAKAEEDSESEKTLMGLKSELEFLKEELEKAKGLEGNLCEKEEHVKHLRSELESVKEELKGLEESYQQLKSETEFLKNELEKAKGFEESLIQKEESFKQIKSEFESLNHELEKAKGFEEKLSQSYSQLKSELEKGKAEKEESFEQMNSELEFLNQELEKAKGLEEKLNVELEASKMAESYAHNLLEEWKDKAEALEVEAKEAYRLERCASESLDSVMKQLDGNSDSLHEAECEISTLKEKVSLLEISVARQRVDVEESERRLEKAREEACAAAKEVESLKSELETLKEEKVEALDYEKLAASSVQELLEEKNKLINEVEALREDEEKSKKAMESLASALHEVSAEAREAKERLLSNQAEQQGFDNQIEDINLILKATNEKYEFLLDDAKSEINRLTTTLEESKSEFENQIEDTRLVLKATNDKYELLLDDAKHEIDQLMATIEHLKTDQKEEEIMLASKAETESRRGSEEEISRLTNLLQQMEQKAESAKEEGSQLRITLQEAISDATSLREALEEAKAEDKTNMHERESRLESLADENEQLRASSDANILRVKELSKMLEEATSGTTENNGDLSDYDLLPRVVEFSEENGHAQQPEHPEPEKSDDVDTTSKTDEEGKEPSKVEESTAESEPKMWESCKIDERDLSAEGEGEHESVEDEVDSKPEHGERNHESNGVQSTSPSKQQPKKKKTLYRKFGSLLKKGIK